MLTNIYDWLVRFIQCPVLVLSQPIRSCLSRSIIFKWHSSLARYPVRSIDTIRTSGDVLAGDRLRLDNNWRTLWGYCPRPESWKLWSLYTDARSLVNRTTGLGLYPATSGDGICHRSDSRSGGVSTARVQTRLIDGLILHPRHCQGLYSPNSNPLDSGTVGRSSIRAISKSDCPESPLLTLFKKDS
jgi:hypothetical protein